MGSFLNHPFWRRKKRLYVVSRPHPHTLSHTHTHTHTHSHSLSLSHTHTHTYTHTYIHRDTNSSCESDWFLNRSILPVVCTLTSTTILDKSGPGINGKEWLQYIPQNSRKEIIPICCSYVLYPEPTLFFFNYCQSMRSPAEGVIWQQRAFNKLWWTVISTRFVIETNSSPLPSTFPVINVD